MNKFEILDKTNAAACDEYEYFVSHHKNGCFMQSLKWTKVKNNWEWEAVAVRGDDGCLTGVCTIIIKRIPFVKWGFLYAPHGPVCDYDDKEVLTEIMQGVRSLVKKYRAYQFMCDPCITEAQREYVQPLSDMGFEHEIEPPELTTIQARNNYMLLGIKGKTPDELIMTFQPEWRNRIRKAVRKGVYCEVMGSEGVDMFYPLMEQTGKRDGFSIRSKDYFVRMLEALGKEHCRLFMCFAVDAKTGEKIPLSGAVATQYAGKTCYVYGASSNENRNLYPNYLMQWNMINWALEGGCDIYDFQGIPFYNDKTHPNYGVYKFKKGFNGEVVSYAGEFYMVYSRFKKKLADAALGAVMKIHDRKTKKILKRSGKQSPQAIQSPQPKPV